ncbi:helix-turn-helix domain-containing protein [Jiangella rhizosphaerae]|uniref:Helix-turn-helix transcriptional regulator n=1 Tax=Jiangella rhizosphaerae TaxID=2293569 RepID=A0A418KQU1_9ACTN|nr:helix-turn-helix domain-containing protein [Jiangella rhizosphaerae]RIQ22556.1 helix-turn-helix transcriptional regulator [Jiangella rhizosphaerae]
MLEQFGLSDEEQTVYLALLDHARPATAAVLEPAITAGLSADAVEKLLDALERRGLADRLPGEPPAYRLVDPALAFAETLAARERDLQRSRVLVDQLAIRHRRRHDAVEPGDLVEIVTGSEATARRLVDVYSSARTQVRAMERPPYGVVNSEPNPIEVELLRAGVRHRVLYEQSAVDLPGRLHDLIGGIAAGEEARVAPTLPARMLLIDDRYAMVPAKAGALITDQLLVVHPSGLLDVLAEVFEETWLRAMPLRLAPSDQDGQVDDDRVILNLLAAGLTEQSIARHVGASQRTVQRRIKEISGRLGARTRFQAGLQAARNGVL